MADNDAKLAAVLEGLADLLAEQRAGSQAYINVNAGGVGVWIATTCCIVCVAVCAALGLLVVAHGQQMSALEARMGSDITRLEQADRDKSAYLAAIYARTGIQPPQDNDNADADHP